MSGNKVVVHDGNVEKALRKFKKKIVESGLLRELHERMSYTKPAVKRKMAKSLAKKRWQKYLKSQELPPKEY